MEEVLVQELPLLRTQEGLSQPLPPQAVVVDALCVAVVEALGQ